MHVVLIFISPGTPIIPTVSAALPTLEPGVMRHMAGNARPIGAPPLAGKHFGTIGILGTPDHVPSRGGLSSPVPGADVARTVVLSSVTSETCHDNTGVCWRLGGEGGIRTHGTHTRTTVFETVPIDHSGTSPAPRI